MGCPLGTRSLRENLVYDQNQEGRSEIPVTSFSLVSEVVGCGGKSTGARTGNTLGTESTSLHFLGLDFITGTLGGGIR